MIRGLSICLWTGGVNMPSPLLKHYRRRDTCNSTGNASGSERLRTWRSPCVGSSSHLRRTLSRNAQSCASRTGQISGLPQKTLSGIGDLRAQKKPHRHVATTLALPPAGGGWEGGTVRTVCPQSSRLPRLPPSCLPPLGGGVGDHIVSTAHGVSY